MYAGAVAHAVDQERKLNATLVSDGEHSLSPPKPLGAPLRLASMDELTVQMRLLAEKDVERAWVAFLSAMENLHWWAEIEYSGDPRQDAPERVTTPLRAAIESLKDTCRRSLNE